MHTITMLGMKGGTGRTMLTMALAAALIAKGRRVLIVDGTEDGSAFGQFEVCETLQRWQRLLVEDGLAEDTLEIETFNEDDALKDLLTRARRRGVDIALVDTSNRRNDRLMTCLEAADLILVPFLGLLEAQSALSQVELPMGFDGPLFGVACALSDPVPTREEMEHVLGAPVLRTTLPRAALFQAIPSRGRLDRLVAGIDERQIGLPAALAMRDAWSRTLDLAAEVEWALNGWVLEPYDPEPELTRARRIVALAAEAAA